MAVSANRQNLRYMLMRRTLTAFCVVAGFASADRAAAQDIQGALQPSQAEQFRQDARFSGVAPAGAFDRLRRTAAGNGTVRVIVGLRAPFTPEEALTEVQQRAQRASIARTTGNVQRVLEGSQHRIVHTFETVPYIAIELSPTALSRLQASGLVATLQADTADRPTLAQSTGIVEAREAVVLGRGGGGRVVAVLDTGIQKTHPFLQHAAGVSKVLSEACYSANGSCPGGVTTRTTAGSGVPCTYAPLGCRHGTHLAGIVAGRGTSFSGVAPGARLISIQVFSRFTGADCASAGEDPCAFSFVSDQIKGLERVYALRNTYAIDAALLPLSGGSFTAACDTDSRKPIIDNLRAARIATVVSSGNDGFSNAVGAPGCISTAVTVGATSKSDAVMTFSNSSSLVDFFAPGQAINSSVTGNGFAVFDGTSMASAHVAGGWAVAKQANPLATVVQVQGALTATGKPVTDTLASPPITRDRIRILSASANLRHTGFGFGINAGPFIGGSIASDGVGLARRTNANPNPTTPPVNRSFALSGIPPGARIRATYIIYQTLGAPDASFTFRGVSRVATLVGASGQFTCWNSTNNGGAFRTYRYTVPAGEVTGNGIYTIGGVGGALSAIHGRPDGQGASLIVIYDVPGAPRNGRMYLRFGSMTGRPGAPVMSHVFSGLTVPSPTVERALHVGIGDGESFSDPAMLFAGTAITPANFWSGREGQYWDDDRIAFSAGLLPAGTTSRTVSQGATGECLTWSYAGLTFKY